MKKTVIGMNGNIGNKGRGAYLENLPGLVRELSLEDYFKEIKNHSSNSISLSTPNGLFIYCWVDTRYPVIVTEEIEYSVPFSFGHAFYDTQNMPYFVGNRSELIIKIDRDAPCVEARRININNKYAGFFVDCIVDGHGNRTPVKSFFLSDWSHSMDETKVFIYLWPRLQEDFGITKLPKKDKREKVKVIVGADPEFELVCCDGSIEYADKIVSGGCSSAIGVDGAGEQVELRPAPGKPHEVVKNLKGLFQEFNARYKNMALSVSGNVYPLGGHIHIGLGKPFSPPYSMLKVLDDFLGRPLIGLSGRARGGYKNLSTWESKDWGFEYRPLPAAYLLKPEICRIVLKIAQNVCDCFINKDQFEYNSPPEKEDYIKIAKLTEREFGIFKNFINDYKKTPETGRLATAFWLNKKFTIKPEPKIVIEFTENWRYEIQRDIHESLTKKLNKNFKNTNTLIYITLYGLKQSRGEVATIPIKCKPPYEVSVTTDAPYIGMEDGKFWIGLPWGIRTNQTIYETNKKEIINSIMEEIERAFC